MEANKTAQKMRAQAYAQQEQTKQAEMPLLLNKSGTKHPKTIMDSPNEQPFMKEEVKAPPARPKLEIRRRPIIKPVVLQEPVNDEKVQTLP